MATTGVTVNNSTFTELVADASAAYVIQNKSTAAPIGVIVAAAQPAAADRGFALDVPAGKAFDRNFTGKLWAIASGTSDITVSVTV